MPSFLRRKFAKNEKMSSVTTHQGNRHISRGRGLLPSHPANFLSQECSDMLLFLRRWLQLGSARICNCPQTGTTVQALIPSHSRGLVKHGTWGALKCLLLLLGRMRMGTWWKMWLARAGLIHPEGGGGLDSAPLGRVDQHSRCVHDCRRTYVGLQVYVFRIEGVCTLDTLRNLLLADREPWVDKRVTKVAALLFRTSHHCKDTPWPLSCGGWLNNMMKHISNWN